MAYLRKMKTFARKHGMRMHLDGARGLNAAAFLGVTPAEMCKGFETVSLCLSKGLGCPVGSLLMGSEKDIRQALIYRKLLGGNWRQAGIYARAGLESFEDWNEKILIDHENAKWVASELSGLSCVDIDTSLVETNMFRFSFQPDYEKFKHDEFVQKMSDEYGIAMLVGF